jgi:hypothetical protein
MLLQFTSDELHLLTDVLEQRDRELRNQIIRTDDDDLRHRLERNQRLLEELEHKLVRRQPELTTNELDLLGEVVDQCERGLTAEIARADDREFRQALEKREHMLRPVHDKVVELCEMF